MICLLVYHILLVLTGVKRADVKALQLKTSRFLLAVGLGLLSSGGAAIAAYPEKPVTVVVGYGPGGGADTITRLYAEKLAVELKQPFVVVNKPGAGAALAASSVARGAADGYTLMVAPTAVFTITPNIRKTGYDPLKDFTPISTLAVATGVVVASKTVPANNLAEFVASAKEHPDKYSFASSGLATSTHLTGEMFGDAAGIKLLHIPYKSSSEYLTDLIDGRVSIAFDPILLNQVTSGKLKLLGVLSDKRLSAYPDVGTTKEAGIDMSASYDKIWYGLVGPAKLPPDVVKRLSEAIVKVSKDPEIAKKLEVTFMQPKVVVGDRFAEMIEVDNKYYEKLIKKLNLNIEK